MAITAVSSCLGPPPLPPGKRFIKRTTINKKLSSTYLSFHDPAIESWLSINETKKNINTLSPLKKTKLRLSYTTHDIDDNNMNDIDKKYNTNLFRSQSEGNLYFNKKYNKNNDSNNNITLKSFDKCIKVIYGSWKNLMQRKFIN